MTRKSAHTVVLVVVGLLTVSGIGVAQDCEKLDGPSFSCFGCPGNANCGCVYIGASCPGYEYICASTQEPTNGAFTVLAGNTFCYISHKCKSQNGGGCHPLSNPCVYDGDPTYVGVFEQYFAVEFCGGVTRP